MAYVEHVRLDSDRLRHMLTRLVFDKHQAGFGPTDPRIEDYRRQVDAVLDAMISLGCRTAACTQGGGESRGRPRAVPAPPARPLVVGPCPCACNRGGFCGGCGHAGCGGRRRS